MGRFYFKKMTGFQISGTGLYTFDMALNAYRFTFYFRGAKAGLLLGFLSFRPRS